VNTWGDCATVGIVQADVAAMIASGCCVYTDTSKLHETEQSWMVGLACTSCITWTRPT